MSKETFSREYYEGSDYRLPYRFHKPENYVDGEKYPLVLFLHGAGERGDDNDLQLLIGIMTALSDVESPLHNSYIIAPQVPYEKQWVNTPWDKGSYSVDDIPESIYLREANEIVKKTIAEYPINEKKVFVCGISMGGYGSWDTLARHSDIYAGGFICCGSGDPSKANLMKDKIIYTYHGAQDSVVPCAGTREMVAALENVGCKNLHYCEYPDLNHGIWDQSYARFDEIKDLMEYEKN